MVNKMEKCLHPVLAKRDQNWFCSRIQAEMKQQGLGYLILQTPYNVMYATGYSPLVGSSAAIIPAEGERRRLCFHKQRRCARVHVVGVHR